MIKNIVLDMGNVLLDYNPSVILDKVFGDDPDKEIIRRELFGGPEWVAGDRGLIQNSQRYDGVKERIPEYLHAKLKEVVENWDICMVPLKGAKEFCEYVKKRGYKIFVLSNACSLFYRYFPKEYDLDFFDGVVVSSDIKILKPDPGIYEYLLETYGLLPEECLFIDDRKDNVDGAVRVGMNAYRFADDYENLIEKYKL